MSPAADVTLMMRPVPSVGMNGSAACVQWNVPITCTSNSQPERLVRQLCEHGRRRDACVVDEDVQRSPAQPGGLCGRGVGGGAVAHVKRARVRLAAVASNALGHSGGRVSVDVGDEHCGTRVGQCGGDGRADTPPAPAPVTIAERPVRSK